VLHIRHPELFQYRLHFFQGLAMLRMSPLETFQKTGVDAPHSVSFGWIQEDMLINAFLIQ
jgi:hypothetical protein